MNSTAVGRVRLRDARFALMSVKVVARRGVGVGPELRAVGNVVTGGRGDHRTPGGRRIAAIVRQSRERRRVVGQQQPARRESAASRHERRSDKQGVDVVLRAVGQSGGRRELAGGADDPAEIGQRGRVIEQPGVGRRVGIVGGDGQPVGILAIDHDAAEEGQLVIAVFTARFVVGGEIEIFESTEDVVTPWAFTVILVSRQALRAVVDDAFRAGAAVVDDGIGAVTLADGVVVGRIGPAWKAVPVSCEATIMRLLTPS